MFQRHLYPPMPLQHPATSTRLTTFAHDSLEAAADGTSMRRVQLAIRGSSASETRVDVVGGMVIGRSPALADIVLDDELVSRRHAQLRLQADGSYWVEDLGSRNGLRYHGRTVRYLTLKNGDRFTLGNTELVFLAPCLPGSQR